MPTLQKPVTVKKNVKHVFTPEETAGLNTEFRQSFANLKSVEAEFDSVKASYKAKTTEAESRMETLNATLQAGFEMRQKECVVIYRPIDKKKDFYLLTDDLDVRLIPNEACQPILIEEMTQEDFERDLIQADSAFDNRSEIILWQAGADGGLLVIGEQKNRWFAALRCIVGAHKIEERLDGEQRATKKRFDAITCAAKRALDWLKANVGKDSAKGFEDGISKAVEAEKEKAQ